LLLSEPAGEELRKGGGIHAREQLVEDAVARDFVKSSRAFFAGKPQFPALLWTQPPGKAGDLADLPGSAEKGHGDDAEHGADAEAGIGSARIRSLAQYLHEVAPLRLGERHLAACDIHECPLVFG